jgi:hypothetical protein
VAKNPGSSDRVAGSIALTALTSNYYNPFLFNLSTFVTEEREPSRTSGKTTSIIITISNMVIWTRDFHDAIELRTRNFIIMDLTRLTQQ